MVTYIDGIKAPKDYRKYNVKTVVGADDYHTMQEVLTRRYTRVLKDNLRKPNLVIVDGGALQVKAAKAVFKELAITDIYIIGLEKDDRHRTRAIVTSDLVEIEIDKHSNLFLLLEAMQEEVHRFAITFFKETHTKNTFNSILDEIDGIGKRRKMTLLNVFNSEEEMASASVEKLMSLGLPKKVAEQLLDKLNNK
jgi:excinuclease ABC subunit C